ncbi:glutamate-5-semialdehyde dehydrogenase [Terricaulis silvestris]|uniref:Gamma-glutamyl phosphate reductase n=1 Tax=Terricaulis silvestris TaxID=2686094 RepID=A0A6I6MRP5_9CAUL|nr:glutamate-5-semialdehyde dehydrogenase [Terricaulis silvestris]QGZ96096.1 Gamma-glutamyl phosphate reductase [Terricaulis silvestris]
MTFLEAQMRDIGQRARAAATALALADPAQRTTALRAMAQHLRATSAAILAANAADVARAKEKALAESFIDRLALTQQRLEAVAAGVETIAALPDPVGAVMAEWTPPNGLTIQRVRTPIGVIGMIFESRPNVAADAGALALRAGNAIILRGGSDSADSVAAIVAALRVALLSAGLSEDAIQAAPTADRAAVGMMLAGLDGAVDVIVPRGGKTLVARVQEEARVPVFAHLEGVCHTYIHTGADRAKAVAITVNAKMRRVSVCGATETLLIDRAIAAAVLPEIVAALKAQGCTLRGDDEARGIVAMETATDEDWRTEYLAPILAVRVVSDLEEAMAHIATYGSQHTDCIVTEDETTAGRFLREVDSAIVLHNASTQFADGGEFGFGGEIGIATGRLHARGPVGAEQLTTFKYVVRGSGQIRPG